MEGTTPTGLLWPLEYDGSRKEGPAIPLRHTVWCISLSLKELPSAEIVTCRGWDSFTSRDNSLSIKFLSPTTCTGSRGHPRMELALISQVSPFLLLRCCCSSRLLHRKWLMPPQSHRKLSGAPPALRMTWASSADGVCSDLPYMMLQCDQSSPVYCSGELPGTCMIPPYQCPFPGCLPVCRLSMPAEIHYQLFGLLGIVLKVVPLAPIYEVLVNFVFPWWEVCSVQGEQKRGQACSLSQVLKYSWSVGEVVEYLGREVLVHPCELQLVPQKCRLYGVESTGEIKEHDPHSASRLFQVRQWSVQEEHDGVVHSEARLIK